MENVASRVLIKHAQPGHFLNLDLLQFVVVKGLALRNFLLFERYLILSQARHLDDRFEVIRYAIEAAFVAERFESGGLEMMPAFRERLVVIAPKEITAIKKPGDLRGMTRDCLWCGLLLPEGDDVLGRSRLSDPHLVVRASCGAFIRH